MASKPPYTTIERHQRTFHKYGSGKNARVVRLPKKEGNHGSGGDGVSTQTESARQTALQQLLTPLSAKQIQNQATAEADLEYQPLRLNNERAQRQTTAQFNYLSGVNKSFNDQLAGQIAGANTQISQIGADTQKNLDANAAQAYGQRDTTQTALNARNAQEASVRGGNPATINPQAQAMIDAMSKSIATTNQQSKDAAVQNTGAAQTYGQQLGGSFAVGAQAQQGQIANQAGSTLAELRAQLSSANATRNQNRTKLINDIRKDEFTKAATVSGLQLDQDKLTQQDVNSRRQAATTRRGQDKTAASAKAGRDVTLHGQGLAHQDRLAKLADDRAKNGKGGVKGLTPQQQRDLHETNAIIRSAVSNSSDLAKSLIGQHPTDPVSKKPRSTPYTKSEIIAALAKQKNMDPQLAKTAYELATGGGHVTPETLRELQRRHIGVPGDWINPSGVDRTY